MTYLFIAHAPEDRDFVRHLSQDLQKYHIEHWYRDENEDNQTLYAELEKATHLLAVLSPAVLLDETMLGSLEFAKQKDLQRIAVRVQPVESIPPQLAGVLPLDGTDEESYANVVETLVEDLQPEPPQSAPQLPEELMTAMHSDNPQLRRNAIESVMAYRDAENDLREAAKEELNMMIFRERDPAIRNLLRAAVQTFEEPDEEHEPDVSLPSKEDLAAIAKEQAVLLDETRLMFFWQTKRWHFVLGLVGFIMGILLWLVGGHWAYALPTVAVGLILPQLNISIRQGGTFTWNMPGPLIGNLILGLIVAGIVCGIVLVLDDSLDSTFLVLNVLAGALFGLLIGWLSSVQVEIKT